jgi:xylulokinase
VMNLTIRQVRDPILVNARGAAFIAAVGLGTLTFDAIPQQIAYAATYTPNAENRAVYDRIFQEFVRYYRQTKGIYRRLNG